MATSDKFTPSPTTSEADEIQAFVTKRGMSVPRPTSTSKADKSTEVTWYRSTWFNALVLGLCNFMAPGIWGAMNSLGGGGQQSPGQVNTANALTFCLMVLTCALSGVLVKYLGIKWTLVCFGCCISVSRANGSRSLALQATAHTPQPYTATTGMAPAGSCYSAPRSAVWEPGSSGWLKPPLH